MKWKSCCYQRQYALSQIEKILCITDPLWENPLPLDKKIEQIHALAKDVGDYTCHLDHDKD
jgi:hypothetical protein